MIYAEKQLSQIDTEIEALQLKRQEVAIQNEKASSQKGIKKWLGYQFESSTGLTKEFSTFRKEFLRELKKRCLLVSLEPLVKKGHAHFEASGFVKNKKTGKLAYWSISDVRYWPDSWYNNILVRTASHERDYTGGSNNSTDWVRIENKLLELTS